MKLTSKEINQKTFEKNFRGYDKDEVAAYLSILSDEWDKLLEEKKDLEKALESSQKEAKKLKDVEDSLFRTLKTAEDTGASIIEEASTAASEIMSDAHHNADSMIDEAKRNCQNLIESAETKANQIMEELKDNVRSLVESYEHLIRERELVIKNLKRLSEDLGDKITTSNESFKKVNIQAHSKIVDDLNKAKAFTMANISSLHVDEEPMVKQTIQEKLEELPQPQVEAPILEEPEHLTEVVTEPIVEIDSKVLESNPEIEASLEVSEAKHEQAGEEVEGEKRVGNIEKPNKGSSYFDQFD